MNRNAQHVRNVTFADPGPVWFGPIDAPAF